MRREVWEGKVAVSFVLDEKEVDYSIGKELPEPVYVSATRAITTCYRVGSVMIKLYVLLYGVANDNRMGYYLVCGRVLLVLPLVNDL